MQAVFDRVTAAARSDIPVLIVGETGTGKERIARFVHESSDRKEPSIPSRR